MVRFASLVAIGLLGTSASAQGAVYRWVDAEGVTHYTDASASIPRGVAVFVTDGEPISELGRPAPHPAALALQDQAIDDQPAVPDASEVYWRGQFRAAKEKIKDLEDAIAIDSRRVAETAGVPVHFACAPGSFSALSVPGHASAFVVGPPGVRFKSRLERPPRVINSGGGCLPIVDPGYERSRDRLELESKALVRAREELHDLERRASFEAVPNEWRR